MNARAQSPSRWGGIIACWTALVATIACNALFEMFRLGGVTSAEVSNQVFAWFTPAGYVFSIWGVIYAALVAWMIAETMRVRKGDALSMRRTALFVASCALNVGWLVAFHFQQIGTALAVLVALWLDLMMLYVGLRDDDSRSRLNLAPFSVYFAWSTVAMIANATHLATRLFAAPLIANQVSTIVLTIAVLAVAFLSVRNSRDYVFPLVILWATVGVGVHVAAVDAMVSTAVFVLSALGAVATYLPSALSTSAPRKATDV